MKDAKTSVIVNVDREAAIRQGINGTESPVTVDLDVSLMGQADRDEVARRLYRKGDGGTILMGLNSDGHLCCGPMTVNSPTQAGVLEKFAKDHQRLAELEAKRKAREAEEEKRYAEASEKVAKNPHDAVCPIRPHSNDPLDRGSFGDGNYNPGAFGIGYEKLSPEAKAAVDGVMAEIKAEIERRKQERERRKELRELEDLRWIDEHGSERLRTMKTEGIPYEKTFREEKAAFEQAEFDRKLETHRPGWFEVDEDDIREEISDVPESAILILKAGRERAGDCRLAWHHDEERYVCVEDFAGRLIMWPGE